MKKQSLLKKVISSILVAIIVLGQFSSYNFISRAETIRVEAEEVYLSLSKTNENGFGYAFGMNTQGGSGEHIWNIVASEDEKGTNSKHTSNFYCIKAEYSHTWDEVGTPSTLVKYNKRYELPLEQKLGWNITDDVLAGQYKNEILWLIDNLYIPGESTEKDFNEYINSAGIFYDEYAKAYYYTVLEGNNDYTDIHAAAIRNYIQTVTEEDIVAVQQAALWYYTNYGETYNKKGIAPWLQYTTEELLANANAENQYPYLILLNEGRAIHATILYNHLIDKAAEVAEKLGNTEYELKNNEAKLWLALDDNGNIKNEQPVIEVHKLPEPPEEPEKLFDLSLRKAIVAINGNREVINSNGEVATRELNDDGSIKNINKETLLSETTAEYKHRKDPVIVQRDDVVTYSITIYNEGEEAGYATKIVDQLPGTWGSGLRLESNQTTVESSNQNIYNVQYETSTNTIILTMAEESPKNVLNPYNAETGILESETVLVQCKVMGKPDTENSKILTNIAYIAEEYNAVTQEIITLETKQDRDSKTWEYPQENNLITTDLGYIGNSQNKKDLSDNNTYYKGLQDDDDFEKVIILPQSFDLSLRKNITKVDGVEVDREPKIDATNLENGTETTAEYKHRKDAVTVRDGSIVEYNISLYNEGSINGVATIVKDQLPSGLKLNKQFFNEEGEDYFVTSVKGNVYKVSYDEASNIVTFEIDEAKTGEVKLLNAQEAGKELDQDVITLQCTVNCKADDEENIYLTNIAYIYEAKQEDGTIVTNQTSGEEADRDSQPHTYPNKTAEELKTTGEIGYKGKEENPSDLAQDNVHFKGQQDDDDFEKLVILPQTFDLSLRKYITEVDGVEVDREPKIDATNLENGTETTAEYKHRKDAVTVRDGSIVEYNISLYNEGSINGVATIVKDQLPSGLKLNKQFFNAEGEEYFVTSLKGNVYKVSYDETNNVVIFEIDEAKTGEVKLLNAQEVGKELDKDVITLQCKVNVKADDEQNIYLTNIAYIYEAKQEDGTIVTNQTSGAEADRDSQPHTYPNKTAEELKTTGDIGYKGNEENPSDLAQDNVHFKGEQDDDDFEKLVILPETFDLSLRKYITEVDGIEVDRTPEIDTTRLENGTETTAEYKHRKDAVTVKNGSNVTYNISIYNEGSIDGIATIVKDQLPRGLKINLEMFDKQGEKYFATSTKGNVYEVIYKEENNLVEFKLDKTKTLNLKYLLAYEIGKELDQESIELECEVNYTADEKENTYFTNIAYIYEAEQKDGTIITNQESGPDSDRDSEPHTYPNKTAEELTTVEDIGYKGKEENPSDLAQDNVYFKGEQDDDDFEKLVMEPKTFDLKLIKFVTAVNNETTGNRVLSVDTSKLNTTDEETTADYILEKNPVQVKAGDFVTYTIRVYNEGNYDGYATEISEDIPQGLEFIVVTDGAIFAWDGTEQKDITEEIKTSDMYNKIIETNSNWGYTQGSTIITTRGLSEGLIKAFGQENAEHADSENKIDYKEIQVIFRVKQDIDPNIVIRNEAAISEDKAVENNGQEVDISDRDSNPEEWKKENSEENYDEEGKWPIYKEDDEDYDNIVTKSFDLSLRKQIVKINDALYTNRFSKLDVEGAYENTLYNYYNVYNNKPKVKAGDVVVYSIRVYNEGEIDGYASLVVDTLPSGLEFVEYESGDGSINDQYRWTLVEGTENVYQTDYLSYEKDTNRGTSESTIIKAYDGEGEASYQEIYIECKIKENITPEDNLLNVAQIADDSDENGKEIKDKDSVPGTSDDETKWKEEDDLDIEILELQEFDLALRKFITKIENGENVEEVTTRIPQVSYDAENEKIIYTHPKDALVVHVGDTVIYTLRVFNEGDIDGYASEIKDDIPEYLEYLPNHEINMKNEWVMYDKEGKETKNVEEAVFIKTEHLAKGKGIELDEESKETNLIKAFNPDSEIDETNPDYKDIEVAFKVKDSNSTEYEIINFAQISDDTDSNGKPIKDRDSEPDNGEEEPKEDDEDIEKVKVEYFDLSLLKYVTKVFVNENGVERVIETGNVGDENDIIPNVQMKKKSIDKIVVKFVYSIKITNEGQIAGEATEITDYVPEGLRFVAEDNELWTDEGNNIISTKQLEGTILQPGESAEVEVVLRWINGSDNLGPKTNIAEISEDHNEENIPDKDSTPDNKKEGEDDIDEATVLLSVNQGGTVQSIYTNLIIVFLIIIFIGAILIKKFIL